MAPGQIGFQNLLSDRSFAFQITATPQKTLLLEFLVPAEGSTRLRWETCNSCHVVLAFLNIRVSLLSLLWGGNDSRCISGLPIYQRLSPRRSEALRRSVLCVSLPFNHCSRHSPTTWFGFSPGIQVQHSFFEIDFQYSSWYKTSTTESRRSRICHNKGIQRPMLLPPHCWIELGKLKRQNKSCCMPFEPPHCIQRVCGPEVVIKCLSSSQPSQFTDY